MPHEHLEAAAAGASAAASTALTKLTYGGTVVAIGAGVAETAVQHSVVHAIGVGGWCAIVGAIAALVAVVRDTILKLREDRRAELRAHHEQRLYEVRMQRDGGEPTGTGEI